MERTCANVPGECAEVRCLACSISFIAWAFIAVRSHSLSELMDDVLVDKSAVETVSSSIDRIKS